MSDSARALLECSFKEMGADELSLVFGCGLPVLRHKPQGRDGGELANALVAMCQGDVDEEEKGLGLGVVVLLEVGSDGLDLLRIGHLAALQELGELVFVHLDTVREIRAATGRRRKWTRE